MPAVIVYKTEAEIARMLDVSPGSVHRWLRDEREAA